MARTDPLRVCWLVPGFPASEDDPHYSFLGREAHQLTNSDDIDLLVVVDDAWEGAQPEAFEIRRLEQPQSAYSKSRSLSSALVSEPRRLPAFCRRPKATYPTLWRIGALIQLLRVWQPEIVHSHFAVPNGTCGVPIARALRAPGVVSLRGVELIKDDSIGYGFRFDRLYEREFCESIGQTDLCFTATEHMRSLAVQAGAQATRSIVLPNSFAPLRGDEAREVRRPTGAAKLLLSVGHLIERKGFDRGVRALSLLPLDFHYVVVGDGPERDTLLELAEQLGVADRVHFVGGVSPVEVASWMREADCYWFLSRAEAFGNVVLEAYAAGARIVATSLGVAPELAYGDNAFLLLRQPDDPVELADATTNVLATKSDEGRAAVLLRFSPEKRSRDLKRLYRSVNI